MVSTKLNFSRKLKQSALAVVAISALVSCSGLKAEWEVAFEVAPSSTGVAYLPIFVGIEKSFYEDRGMDVATLSVRGGATWFYRERLRALVQLESWPYFEETLQALCFDTAVYDQSSLEFIVERAGADRMHFSCEMLGAARAVDPRTGKPFDDIVPDISASKNLTDAESERYSLKTHSSCTE